VSRDGYLPPDVDYGDTGAYDPEDPECACGHPRSDHTGRGESCEHVELDEAELLCPCSGFEPPNAY
jgi:hypothetical protein